MDSDVLNNVLFINSATHLNIKNFMGSGQQNNLRNIFLVPTIIKMRKVHTITIV